MKKRKLSLNPSSIISILIVSCFPTVMAFEVTHQVRPQASFETSALNFSCSTMTLVPAPIECNPALFSFSQYEGISLIVIGKADGDSIDNGRDLIFDPVTEPLIRRLFEKSSFNSFTFNSNISFKTSLFELSYSPYFLLADLFIFNPAFPEISVHLVNRESLRATSGREIMSLQALGSSFKLHAGASLYYYQHTYESTVFSLFDLSFRKPEELISLKNEYGISGDVAFFLLSEGFWPNLSLQIKNIESDIGRNQGNNNSFSQRSLYMFETYTSLGVGKSFSTTFGGVELNLEFPVEGYLENYNLRHAMLGARYNLHLFSLLLGAGQDYQNIGLRFNSPTFNVGISYSRENDIKSFDVEPEQSVYTGVDINL